MKLSDVVALATFIITFLLETTCVVAARRLERDDRKGKAKKKMKKKGKQDTSDPIQKVVIGGAGFSGIAAGRTFHDFDNDFEFIILEATDHVGGRVFSAELTGADGESFRVSQGANWIVGFEGSPIWDLALRYGLDGTIDGFSANVYDENGNFDLNETLYASGTNCGRLFEAFVGCQLISRWCLQPGPGDFFNSTTEEFCKEIFGLDFVLDDSFNIDFADGMILFNGFYPPVEENPAIATACEFFFISNSQGARTDEISLKEVFQRYILEDFEPGVYFVHDSRGYEWLAKKYAAEYLQTSINSSTAVEFNDPRLQLQTKIIKVEWDPEGVEPVEITCCTTRKVERADSYTRYPCMPYSEETIYTDYFMSTFSIGVLKQVIENERGGRQYPRGRDFAPVFDPPLSSFPLLTTAIETGQLANYVQAAMKFSFRFWPANVEYLVSAYTEGNFVGDFAPLWKLLDVGNETLYLPDSNILWVAFIDRRADQVSRMTNAEAVAQLLPVLNGMFSEEITALNDGKLLTPENVEDVAISRWSLDPLYRGTYSYDDVLERSLGALGQRYGNLIFSGESSCLRHGGYTHGALVAGERSASQLLFDKFSGPVPGPNICDEQLPEERRMKAEDRFLKKGMNFIPMHDFELDGPFVPGMHKLSPEDILDRFREYGMTPGK